MTFVALLLASTLLALAIMITPPVLLYESAMHDVDVWPCLVHTATATDDPEGLFDWF